MIAKERTGVEPKRSKYIRDVNLRFGVDLLKHHAANDPPTIELDEHTAAENAITRALCDYIELCGQELPFVKAFLQYTWVTRNGSEVMKLYDAQPDRMKRLKKR